MPSDYEAKILEGLMTSSLKITREVKDVGGGGFSIMGSYGGVKLTYADRVHDMPTRERGGIERNVVGIYSGGVDYSSQSAAAILNKPKIGDILTERDQKNLGYLVGYNQN